MQMNFVITPEFEMDIFDLMMHARIAVGRWVHRDAPAKQFDPDLKLPKWGKRKLKRDR